jgi:hypothetical protein
MFKTSSSSAHTTYKGFGFSSRHLQGLELKSFRGMGGAWCVVRVCAQTRSAARNTLANTLASQVSVAWEEHGAWSVSVRKRALQPETR